MPRMLVDLPTEILLRIASHLVNTRHRNQNLRALSLTCHCLRPIAQEILIINPRLKASHLHIYLAELGRLNKLRFKVETLELSSSLYSDDPKAYDGPNSLLDLVRRKDDPSKRFYAGVRKYLIDVGDVMKRIIGEGKTAPGWPIRELEDWEKAMDTFVIPALVVRLIVGLKSLKELKLTGISLRHAPILVAGLGSQLRTIAHTSFLTTALNKIEVLEMPSNMDSLIYHVYVPNSLCFLGLEKLKVLTLTLDALRIWTIGGPTVINRRLGAHMTLPKSLVCLRITEADATVIFFLSNLFVAVEEGRFPNFRRLELYFIYELRDMRWLDTRMLHRGTSRLPLENIQTMCSEAGVELSICCPGAARMKLKTSGETIWSMREQGELVPAETPGNIFGDPVRHELEWDADGDVIMRGT